jgi:succinoglycan biosynthesis protein ExoM
MRPTPNNTLAIDVCVATFRRPEMLAQLLAALRRQRRLGMALRIVVIDNDAAGSARRAVDTFRASSGMDVVYDIEPQQNIALARNRALGHCRGAYVAFIDDDEVPVQAWLVSLLECLRRCRADIVFGPVHARLPPGAPLWATDCFRKPDRRSGDVLQCGGAGNVLMRAGVLQNNARFDPAYGLTGGEDTDFFYRQHLAGRRLVWCAEALASEHVPDVRLQLDWQRQRAFRGGQTYFRVFVRRYTMPRTALWFALKSGQLAAGLLAAPLLRLFNYRAYVAFSLRLAGAAGQLSRCFSAANFEEYHARRYH